MLARTDDHWEGRRLVRMDVAALSDDAPVPPGLPRVPAAGQAWVSPALAELLVTTPTDELGDRFDEVVGTIEPAGLMAPDELAAVVGRDPGSLRAEGARVVTELNGTRRIPVPTNPLIRILVVIALVGALAPVAVFVASATRLSAARREQRLAALRLAGATPAQVTRLAAVEALVATVPGALGGVVLFFVLRPLIAMVPLGQATWFADTIVPPLLPAVGLLLVVQVVGVGAAVAALRRVTVSPLGVRRRERRGPLRRLRLLPLAVSIAVFAYALSRVTAADGDATDNVLWLLAGSFLGIIVSIAIAGPWITAIVGRVLGRMARGPVPLLAGRRLADDPRGAFGAIGGVVMAVFVGSAYLSIAAFAAAASPADERLAVRPDVLMAPLPGDGSRCDGRRAAISGDSGRRGGGVHPGGRREAGHRRPVRQAPGSSASSPTAPTLVAVLSAPNLDVRTGPRPPGAGRHAVTEATVQTALFLAATGA